MRLDPSEASILVWTGAIPGPEGSVYEGGLFEFDLTLPTDYPYVLIYAYEACTLRADLDTNGGALFRLIGLVRRRLCSKLGLSVTLSC